MKRYLLLFVAIFLFLGAFAQNISVKSFRSLPMDMTASSLEGKRMDQNGEVAALIKVVTTETGFTFEGGALGIVDTKQRNGEIWVWVPRGLRKITVLHQRLGVLRDYMFPIEIEAERTYEMVLTTAIIETIVKEEVKKQFLAFQITPANAVLEVDGQVWSLDASGGASRYLDFGTYSYRVRASDYFPEEGRVTVDDPKNTKIVPVTLKPDFAEVTLKVNADAEIWVNNQRKGLRSWTGPLGSGFYKIECRQAGHETTEVAEEITTAMNGQTITLPAPKPIYGSLLVESTPNFCKIFVDGREVGTTPKSVNEILVGSHEIKLTKEGYVDYTVTVTIAKGEPEQVKATLQEGSKDEETFTVNGVSFTMKLVEGGTFRMGATSEQGSDAYVDETPVHSVTLSDYYMGETEVTQALWKAVMGNDPSNWKGNDLPVETVSWNDCQEFIRKLNQKTGKSFRLPTEAEWEYAARGGKMSYGRKYAGGYMISIVAWYRDNGDKQTHIVKTKSPNELGLYDMSGNVWEWCSDVYDDYGSGSLTNPNPQSTSKSYSHHVLRGGSWMSNARLCRVSRRDHYAPNNRDNRIGFRLCLPQ